MFDSGGFHRASRKLVSPTSSLLLLSSSSSLATLERSTENENGRRSNAQSDRFVAVVVLSLLPRRRSTATTQFSGSIYLANVSILPALRLVRLHRPAHSLRRLDTSCCHYEHSAPVAVDCDAAAADWPMSWWRLHARAAQQLGERSVEIGYIGRCHFERMGSATAAIAAPT